MIYDVGETMLSRDGKIKASYLISSLEGCLEIKYGVAVSSKKGSAVWRNRFKRLIREAVKDAGKFLNSNNYCKEKSLLIIFSPSGLNEKNHQKLFLKDIEPSVVVLLSEMGKIF